ncbi:MAG: MBL fold metallo-hydrolase [Clostridia bacterium]|nr:MBL fold metallo-hydrolase [Clostridia bacterium]
MRVKFICHSGFFIEGEKNCLLFDYWKGDLPPVPAGKKLWIFASHHHPDHYDAAIYQYGEKNPNTRYILGADITLNSANRQKMGVTDEIFARCTRVHKNDVIEEDGVTIRAIKSSDMGAAFHVTFEGKAIYHAGDHNLWIWHESELFDRNQIQKFYEEVEKLRGLPVDAAFLPLDPRLGDEYWRGFDAFARLFYPQHIFPMHMVDDYSMVQKMKSSPIARPYASRIAAIDRESQEFEI